MFNKTLDLITETFFEDDIGQQVPTPEFKKVFASEKSIQQSEFFAAGQTEIKPSACFIIRRCDYTGEAKLRYPAVNNGKVYSIYRTYKTKNELIELYCEVRNG